MKKLSKITESIWSDIQDRSAGDTVRKEDDINLMSIEDFCGYLNDNYISEDGYRTYRIYYVSKVLSIAVLMDGSANFYSIKYDYGHNMIYLNDEIEDCVPELCQKLKNNFKVVKNRVGASYTKFIIYPSDGSECTNRFFVDVLDFIIDNADEKVLLLKKKHINESIWSDIQDRSAGDTIRKEDDINLFDCDELYDYIYSLYEQINQDSMPSKSQIVQRFTYFSIPIFKSGYKAYRLDCTFENSKISKITLMASVADVKDFKQALIDNFDVTTRGDGALSITAKDGTVSNQVCMDLIKTIVENAPKPYLKKREN